MSNPAVHQSKAPQLRAALPTDEIRQVMWRVADRRAVQKLSEAVPPLAQPISTAAKLLSAIEPILHYQRRPDVARPETHVDVFSRLIDIWAIGEAAASLALAAARAPRDGGNQPVAEMLSLSARLWTRVEGAAATHNAAQLIPGEAFSENVAGILSQLPQDAQGGTVGDEDQSLVRHQLRAAMMNDVCIGRLREWMAELKQIAARQPGTGACTVGSAIDLWLWTVAHFQKSASDDGANDAASRPNTAPLADALCWLLAARSQILDVLQLTVHGDRDARSTNEPAECARFLESLCHIQSARAAGEVGRICAELVFGYAIHPAWDPDCDICIQSEEIDALEGVMPGISYGARLTGDVMERDGSHVAKAGPCARLDAFQGFVNRRSKLDGCMSGARVARDQAVAALAHAAI